MRSPVAVVRARVAARRARKAASTDPAFDAFISYSHAADSGLAKALQRGVHRFAKPWFRLRALRVFRDEANLAADPDLWGSIREALLSARYLIVVASPEAARSVWVGREMETWTERHGTERLLIVLTAGQIAWRDGGGVDWEVTDALPRSAGRVIAGEPRYLDLRWARGEHDLSLRDARFREAVAELAAPLHGKPKDTLIGADVREHQRARRLAGGAIAVISGLAVVAGAAAVVAVDQRNEAQSQLSLATSRYLASQAQAVVEDQRAQGLLLSLEALRARDTPEARDALLDAVLRTPNLRTMLQPKDASAVSVTVSPDGELLAAGTTAGDVWLWEWSTGRLRRVLAGTGRWVTDVAITPDNARLVSAHEEGRLQRWDLRTGRAIGAPISAGPGGAVQAVAIDPEGRTVAAGTSGGKLGLWDLETGRRMERMVKAHDGVSGVTFSDGGRVLVTGGLDGDVRRWSAAGLLPLGNPLTVTQPSVSDLAGSAGPVAAALQDGSVAVLEAAGLEEIGRHKGQATSVAVDPQGFLLASGGFDHAVRLWNPRTRQSLGPPLRGHIAFVSDVAVAPAGRGVASAGADGVIAVWDLYKSSRLSRELSVGKPETESPLAWTPNGRTLFAGGADGSITRWDARGGSLPPLSGPRRDVEVTGVAVDPNGAWLAAGRSTGRDFPKTPAVELWDLRDRRARPQTLALPEQLEPFVARTPAFSPDGSTLAVGGLGTVLVWRLDGPRQPRRLAGDTVAFSPDGKTLAATTGQPDDGTIRLYDVGTGKKRGELKTGHASFVWDVAFSPDGSTVAAGDNDGTVVLWNAHNRKRVTEPLTGFDSRVDYVAFSPDGRTIAASSSDEEVRLWDARTRQPLGRPLEGHFIVFSPDGAWLAASTFRGTAHLWSLELGNLRKQACALAGRNLGQAEWDQFIGALRQYEPTCPGLPRGRPATPVVSAD